MDPCTLRYITQAGLEFLYLLSWTPNLYLRGKNLIAWVLLGEVILDTTIKAGEYPYIPTQDRKEVLF